MYRDADLDAISSVLKQLAETGIEGMGEWEIRLMHPGESAKTRINESYEYLSREWNTHVVVMAVLPAQAPQCDCDNMADCLNSIRLPSMYVTVIWHGGGAESPSVVDHMIQRQGADMPHRLCYDACYCATSNLLPMVKDVILRAMWLTS
jgi:hypothetical protein